VVVEPGLFETEFGDVVAEGLLKLSGSGAYAKLTLATAKATKDAYARGCGTDATVIARVAAPTTSCATCWPRLPAHLREEVAEDYRRMMYGETRDAVEQARASFVRKWCIRSSRGVGP
jgi:hypothetical protein